MQLVNATLVPIELCVSRNKGKDLDFGSPKFIVNPGAIYYVPIESAYADSIFWRPFGFGYEWSSQCVNWKDIHKDTLVCLMRCNSFDTGLPDFRFQLNSILHSHDR